jgi:hypothetical protein
MPCIRSVLGFIVLATFTLSASVTAAKPSVAPPPRENITSIMEWIKRSLPDQAVRWAISLDGARWIVFDGNHNFGTITFLADAGGRPGKAIGGGLHFQWLGPTQEGATRSACLRLNIPFASLKERPIHEVGSTGVGKGSTIVYSSAGDTTIKRDGNTRISGTVLEFESSADDSMAFFQMDPTCLADKIPDLPRPAGSQHVPHVALIFSDATFAKLMLEAVRNGIRESRL